MHGWIVMTLEVIISRSQNVARIWSCQNGYSTIRFTWLGETLEGVKKTTPCKGAFSCDE
jgi:hypothetical protein